jgi:hypothetical protein
VWDDEPGRPVWKGIGRGAPGRRRYQRRTAKNGEELSPRLMGSSSDREPITGTINYER